AAKFWNPSYYEVIPASVSYSSVAFAIKSCRFRLGGRYHMTRMAACTGLPAMQGRGNCYKDGGLSATWGGLSPVLDSADPEAILNASLEILDEQSTVQSRLLSARSEIMRSLEDASSWLRDEFSGIRSSYPSSFLIPPGHEIDASVHMEPYRENSIAHAKTFEYPPVQGD